MITPDKEVTDIILEMGGDTLGMCYQCGTCSALCPWGRVRPFSARKLMRQAQLGSIDFTDEKMWSCATCGSCTLRCPRGVNLIDVMKAFRRIITELELAKIPDPLRLAVKNITYLGNPSGEPEARRRNWWQDAGVEPQKLDGGYLYFSCCIAALDPSIRKISVSVAQILRKAGVQFSLIGEMEKCCGESVRKAGFESVFTDLAQSNIANFAPARKVITSSPHCYHTFKNEYPGLGSQFEAIHYTQLVDRLIQDGKLSLSKEVKSRAVYHDSCYLGRHNGEFEAPRRVLQAIPGLELIEFPENRENALCCGGGGGRIWMDTPRGQRFSDLKLEQAVQLGADILVTACPYCMLMFNDSLVVSGMEHRIRITDLSELVLHSLGL